MWLWPKQGIAPTWGHLLGRAWMSFGVRPHTGWNILNQFLDLSFLISKMEWITPGFQSCEDWDNIFNIPTSGQVHSKNSNISVPPTLKCEYQNCYEEQEYWTHDTQLVLMKWCESKIPQIYPIQQQSPSLPTLGQLLWWKPWEPFPIPHSLLRWWIQMFLEAVMNRLKLRGFQTCLIQ